MTHSLKNCIVPLSMPTLLFTTERNQMFLNSYLKLSLLDIGLGRHLLDTRVHPIRQLFVSIKSLRIGIFKRYFYKYEKKPHKSKHSIHGFFHCFIFQIDILTLAKMVYCTSHALAQHIEIMKTLCQKPTNTRQYYSNRRGCPPSCRNKLKNDAVMCTFHAKKADCVSLIVKAADIHWLIISTLSIGNCLPLYQTMMSCAWNCLLCREKTIAEDGQGLCMFYQQVQKKMTKNDKVTFNLGMQQTQNLGW